MLSWESRNIISNADIMKEQHRFGHDMWLIFASQSSQRKRSYLENVLKSSVIRFDSSIFAFYKEGPSKLFIF